MTNWRLVACNLAEAVEGDWRVSETNIKLAGHAAFFFAAEAHPLDASVTEKYRHVYSYIMTLANRKGLVEHEKVNKLKLFMWQLHVSQEYVHQVLTEAGYLPPNAHSAEVLAAFKGRDFHPEVVSHCQKLFSQGYYFFAISEACKAYNMLVKKKLGTTKDGTNLMLSEFGAGKRIRVVPGETESEQNLLEGIKYLSAGLIHGYRNPTSHETMQSWEVSEQDCLDILSLASYLFRQLDKSEIKP